MAKQMTMGVIVGNRGFFPSHLATSGRLEMIAALEAAGIKPVVLTPEETAHGAVETYEDAKKCAALFKAHAAEVDGIINRVHTPQDRPKPKVVFERNEQVRIVDGPFANFNGNVEEIDNDHSRLKVSVTIFGRSTPVELDFASVEKLG